MICVKFFAADEFNSLRGIWETLQQGEDMTAFQSFSWYAVINRQYQKKANRIPGRAVYAVAYEDGEAQMIAPIHVFRIPFLDRFNLSKGAYILGKWGCTDYLNFIYARFSPACFEELVSCIKQRWKVEAVHIHQIHPDTKMAAYLQEKYGHCLQLAGSCACIHAQKDFETYRMSLSKNVRQNIRTAENRSEKDGLHIRYSVLNVVPDADAEEFLSIYAERQEIKNGGKKSGMMGCLEAVWEKRLARRFRFLEYCMTNCDVVKTVALYDGERKIGFFLALTDQRAYRVPVICFKKEYARYSPGIQLIIRFLKDQYADGLARDFDLLKGTEKYKLDLGAAVFTIGYYKL